MKRTVLSIMLAALAMGAAAQSADNKDAGRDTTQVVTENMTKPQFPGGEKALAKFLLKNLKYPEEASAYEMEGTVIMTFFVNTDGTLSDIAAHDCKIDRFNTTKFAQETEVRQKELKEKFAKLFAKEGARVIRKMPKWIPAKLDGKAVRVKMSQQIRFADPYK